jgi:predicted nucleotidyltransferase
MTNTSLHKVINISGRLPAGLVEMYQAVEACAINSKIEFLIVGAMARDLVLYHGFGAGIERGTRDVDFAIQVESWQEFDSLKAALVHVGFSTDATAAYRLGYIDSEDMPWELDILPFGELTDTNNDISWPPNGDFVMSMLGFAEALKTAWRVQIVERPACIVPVANPAAMIVLKMIAWTERDVQLRRKDAQDIAYIIKNYEKIPEVYERLYQEDYMEKCDWDIDAASALLLGQEVALMITDQTLSYLVENFVKNEINKRSFSDEMNAGNSEVWLVNLLSKLNS